ncbi:MAG: leucyl/phenylalanyl-tRNA--protein transferase [Acidobacteriota bacterium]
MIPSAVLVSAYASGWFPMAVEPGEIRWYSPDPRGVIPLECFHLPSRLARVLRSGRFEVGFDRDFEGVIRACAAADRGDDEDGTWIDDEILESYLALHRAGLAHSVEVRQEGRLAGGLYGVSLGGAFFGESMFHHVTDASKVALAALVERLRSRGHRLLDVQWVTPHLARFGAIEIPRRRYLQQLEVALAVQATFR